MIAEWRSAIAALQRPPGLPSSYVPARTKREVTLLSSLDANAGFEIGTVAAGHMMWVAPDATQTYREIMTADGRDAYADDDALEFAPAEATSAGAPAGGPPAGRPGTAALPHGAI